MTIDITKEIPPTTKKTSLSLLNNIAKYEKKEIVMTYRILDKISSPRDVKRLPTATLPSLASDMRKYISEITLKNGGHLASNLGCVELAISLVRALDLPNDRVIFDVGHQAYGYKILTDRRESFKTLRQPGGISGFPKRSESFYDSFGTGHSSTAISAALGFAEADRINGRDSFTVAVVGDGAFTGGLVHEALNNINENLRLIIILNENEMSISRNIGGFARTIAKIRSTHGYYTTKKATRDAISSIPVIGKATFNAFKVLKQRLKDTMYGSNYFEDMGLYYLGPADGNSTEQVEALLKEALSYGRATVIHLKTKKGKGLPSAEKNPDRYHAILPGGKKARTSFSEKMGELLTEKASHNDKICAITASMALSCGLAPFKNRFPDRFFDVGIAEAHALVFAAGLAAAGMKPVVPVYSSFLQRAYDSILHDVALQGLPVTVMVDRASLAEGDGPTHHGIYDVSFLSAIPGVNIYAPSDYSSLNTSLDLSLNGNAPSFIRYPHSGEFAPEDEFKVKGRLFKASAHPDESCDLIIITYGRIVKEAISASHSLLSKKVRCKILLIEQLKPFDMSTITEYIKGTSAPIIFLEEGIKSGGAGERLLSSIYSLPEMAQRGYKILAIDDHFADRRTATDYFTLCGISAECIENTAFSLVFNDESPSLP